MEFKQTETFRKWRMRLKDERARGLIASRLDRLAAEWSEENGRKIEQL